MSKNLRMSKNLEPLRYVVHPVTGEQVELAGHPAGDLLHILELLKDRAAQLKQWADAVENELVSRGADPQMYEIQEQWAREWDVDDLTATVSDLVQRGHLSIMDVSGLVKQGPNVVDGKKAKALLDRAEGQALVDLRQCFTWKRKGRAKVTPVHAEIEQ